MTAQSRIGSPVTTETGTFVTDWVGFTTAQATTWTYRRVGRIVTIKRGSTTSATSNANGFLSGLNDMPVSIRPIPSLLRLRTEVRDNGVSDIGFLLISFAGQISYLADMSSNSFQIVGTKGSVGGQEYTYMMD